MSTKRPIKENQVLVREWVRHSLGIYDLLELPALRLDLRGVVRSVCIQFDLPIPTLETDAVNGRTEEEVNQKPKVARED